MMSHEREDREQVHLGDDSHVVASFETHEWRERTDHRADQQ